MWNKIEKLFTFFLGIAAFAVALSAVHASFFAAPSQVAMQQGPPVYVDDWEAILPVGVSMGGLTDAAITIIMFGDLECPACRSFHTSLDEVLEEYPEQVRAVFVHFPLSYHRFAMPAARAADCARRMGAFRQWVDIVYEKQDSLGLLRWSRMAAEAGIPDTASIQRCAIDSQPIANIESGRKMGESINITGTPTVLINGWRYSGTPSKEELDSAVVALLRGDDPV